MLSAESIEFLNKNNFQVQSSTNKISIDRKRSVNWLWPIAAGLLLLGVITLLIMGFYGLGFLLIVFIIYPMYRFLTEIKRPKELSIDFDGKLLNVKNQLFGNHYYRFKDIKSVGLSSFDKTLEPNAFQQEVVTRFFYIDLNLNGKKNKTILIFKEAEEKSMNKLVDDFTQVFNQ